MGRTYHKRLPRLLFFCNEDVLQKLRKRHFIPETNEQFGEVIFPRRLNLATHEADEVKYLKISFSYHNQAIYVGPVTYLKNSFRILHAFSDPLMRNLARKIHLC